MSGRGERAEGRPVTAGDWAAGAPLSEWVRRHAAEVVGPFAVMESHAFGKPVRIPFVLCLLEDGQEVRCDVDAATVRRADAAEERRTVLPLEEGS